MIQVHHAITRLFLQSRSSLVDFFYFLVLLFLSDSVDALVSAVTAAAGDGVGVVDTSVSTKKL